MPRAIANLEALKMHRLRQLYLRFRPNRSLWTPPSAAKATHGLRNALLMTPSGLCARGSRRQRLVAGHAGELRASMSLARLWRSQGEVQEARELLAPVYG
jgi:hypothetical protein